MSCEAIGRRSIGSPRRLFQAEWVAPLSTTYRGWTVYELPPNGQGFAALLMLNILEHVDLTRGAQLRGRIAALIEAKKLA